MRRNFPLWIFNGCPIWRCPDKFETLCHTLLTHPIHKYTTFHLVSGIHSNKVLFYSNIGWSFISWPNIFTVVDFSLLLASGLKRKFEEHHVKGLTNTSTSKRKPYQYFGGCYPTSKVQFHLFSDLVIKVCSKITSWAKGGVGVG